jgi:hypothetical protein
MDLIKSPKIFGWAHSSQAHLITTGLTIKPWAKNLDPCSEQGSTQKRRREWACPNNSHQTNLSRQSISSPKDSSLGLEIKKRRQHRKEKNNTPLLLSLALFLNSASRARNRIIRNLNHRNRKRISKNVGRDESGGGQEAHRSVSSHQPQSQGPGLSLSLYFSQSFFSTFF